MIPTVDGEVVLELHDLAVGSAAEILDDVSFDLRAGEICGLIGPNGGADHRPQRDHAVYEATSGRLVLSGVDITTARPHTIARLGVSAPSRTCRSGRLTVHETVMVGGHTQSRGGAIASMFRLGTADERVLASRVPDPGPPRIGEHAFRQVTDLPFSRSSASGSRALAGRRRCCCSTSRRAGSPSEVDEPPPSSGDPRRLRRLMLLVEHHWAYGLCDPSSVDFGTRSRGTRQRRSHQRYRGVPRGPRVTAPLGRRHARRAPSGAAGIDLRVEEREVVVILGANGAGKTTTLRAICQMLTRRCDEPRRRADGAEHHRDRQDGVAHVPQGRARSLDSR